MFSVKFISREDKNNSVRIRVTNNRKSAQFSLGITATQEELDNALSNDPKIKLSNIGRMLHAFRAKIDLTTEHLIIEGRENDSASTLADIFKNALIGSGSVDRIRLLYLLCPALVTFIGSSEFFYYICIAKSCPIFYSSDTFSLFSTMASLLRSILS